MEGKGKKGRPAGRWKDMIAGDIKRRAVIGWYDLAQDRKVWRSVVYGERVDAGVRRRRKQMAREAKQNDEKKQEGAVMKGGLK